MKNARRLFVAVILVGWSIAAGIASAAYQHAGDADKDPSYFLNVYPDKAGTKLDNCATCHTGGTVVNGTKTTTYGSCQWCHYEYGYAGTGNIDATLNQFGRDYRNSGRNEAALKSIDLLDSDGDGYLNGDEIGAIRYPGDPNDDPTKVVAPFRIFTKEQLMAMPQHSQFMLMNTTKSGDYYAEYSGVVMEDLLNKAGISPAATKITVYAPDGFAQGHPMDDSAENTDSAYAPFVKGKYPAAAYFYTEEADKAMNPDYGWCDYTSPGNADRENGEQIFVGHGLRLLLALRADGKELVPGGLGSDNKLTKDSEGPFRVVTPQKFVGPPDQASTAVRQDVIWPYDTNSDHNAGFSSKCTTIVKVEPLPAGTTDINVLEAGWTYIDQGKIVLYGALEGPRPILPLDGAARVPFEPTVFKWIKSPGIDKEAIVSYRLEYTCNPDLKSWTTVIIDKETKKHSKFHSCMAKEDASITLEPGKKYWWRITDVDANGGSTTSPVRSFETREKKCRR
jgi:hypothetical protein